MNSEHWISPFQRWILILAISILAQGCAISPDPNDRLAMAEHEEVNDPFEHGNRGIFKFNRTVDRMALKPAATAYRDYLPTFLTGRVRNVLANFRAPVIFLNDLLQGEVPRALQTLSRFVVNSTIGLVGLFDMASTMDMEGHDEDFGQTLAVWGVPEGPFIMLPVFGPSNPRDTVGKVVDFLIDPLRIWASNSNRDWVPFVRAGTQAVDTRSDTLDLLNDVEKSSLDFYAAIRSLYRQRRADAISNGRVGPVRPVPGIGEQPGPALNTDENVSRSTLR
jgi:phospholipid-binding lipoprotein MlaA